MKQEDSKQQGAAKSTRRAFIKKTATVAGATAAAAQVAKADIAKTIFPQTVLGANEIIRTGHIGTGGMGRADLGFVLQRDDMQPIAICDLWYRNLDRAEQMLKQKFQNYTKHHDFREIIDNKDVDAVVIATPDHWHSLCSLYAADAGKDIYCEKPLSTTIGEGRAVVNKIREKNVVFQGGTMQRSGAHFQEAVQLVQGGHIGKIARVECYIHDEDPLAGIGMGDDKILEGCDWDFHQGWVEHKPFNTNRWIYNFRWFLDYSGGKITDWGAHLVDIALWGMDPEMKKAPKSVVATGGKYLMEDNRTTPDTLEVIWEYDNFVLSFGNRVWNNSLPYTDKEGKPVQWQSHGILFHGTLGTLRVDRGGYEIKSIPQNGGCEEKTVGGGQLNEPHWQNFADCVRSRQRPICDVEVIYNTPYTCHMGTCSYVAGGAKLGWDAEKERFTGGDADAVKKANDWAYRPYLNGWSLTAPYQKKA